MSRSNDIYGYDLKLKRKLEKIRQSDNLSKNVKKKILEFQEHCAAEGMRAPQS